MVETADVKPKERSDEDKRKILVEAKKRYRRCVDWEATARSRQGNDIKFCEGDSDNNYQWPEDVRTSRNQRPCLTINKTRQHCLDVLNDSRQSRVAISIKATGGDATYESAQIYEGVVRHIEYQSRAAVAYQHGLSFAVRGGTGYWRVTTDYSGDDSFDQEIFVRRIKDPNTVYLDPDINEFDGSDARFGFVATDMPNDEFEIAYTKFKDSAGNASFGEMSWHTEDHTTVAEYFRCVPQDDQLLAFTNPQTGQVQVMPRSRMDKDLLDAVIDNPNTMVRNTVMTKVEWFMIVGDEIAEEKVWPGRYIPLVRCVGEETVIDGQMDRKGLTRGLKDAQRMFNYNSSAFVEYGALQSKTPYVGPLAAFEDRKEWDDANTQNYSYLPYNHMDDSGQIIPAPQRQEPPTGAPVYVQGMDQAAEFMRMVSGQYQADMGAPSNERSGVAIQQRQRQGDNATYHYLDHQAVAIRFTGMIILDLIPKVYDTERLIKIRAENGDEQEVTLDPQAPEALQKEKLGEAQVKMIFNPNMGKYGVESDVGPAYATKRQEAFAAYTQILTQNKELTALIGDIALRFGDFPGAEEAAQRLHRMVPPQALGEGDSPDVVQLKTQLAQMQKVLEITTQKLADKAGSHQNDQEKNAVNAYRAQTDRVKALQEAWVADPEGVMALVKSAMDEAVSTSGGVRGAADDSNPPIEPVGPGIVGPDPSAPQAVPNAPVLA